MPRTWPQIAAALLLLVVGGLAQAAETIEIGAEDDWYPYGGQVRGEAAGLGPDLVRASFAAVGIEVRFQVMPYARCLQLVKQGRLIACNQPARTAETEQAVLWPDRPLFSARSLIYARAPSDLRGLSASGLAGRRVAVTNGYEYGSEFDGNRAIQREVATREISVFRMLAASRVDYAVAYEKAAELYFKQHPSEFGGRFQAVGQTAVTDMYCAFSKLHPQGQQYLARFNEGFARIRANGELKAIEARWR